MFSLLNILSDDNADDDIHSFTEDLSLLPIQTYNYTRYGIERYHCNGIFCVFNPYSGTFTLCNPAIKEFKLLPKPCHEFVFTEVEFGYDPKSNDYYKVVIFGPECLSKSFRAEV